MWHDFEDEATETDEFDQYDFSEDQETVVRTFWAGTRDSGQIYSIMFVKVEREAVLQAIVGEVMHNNQPLGIPDSGCWVVTFDVADYGNEYNHVALGHAAKKDLATEVACAVYDHYNVTKAGIYCWMAVRDDLVNLYDVALGFTARDSRFKLKSVPLSDKRHQLGENRRGYAIITRYY